MDRHLGGHDHVVLGQGQERVEGVLGPGRVHMRQEFLEDVRLTVDDLVDVVVEVGRAARYFQVPVQVAGEEGDAAVEFLDDLQALEAGTGEVALHDTDVNHLCLRWHPDAWSGLSGTTGGG